MSFAPDSETLAKPEALLRVPVGLASPLWGLFAGAAMSGAAWWWMTRWARPQNLEAMFAAALETRAPVEPEAATFAAVADEAPGEAPAEASAAPISPAPISPAPEALAPEVAPPADAAPEPKPRKKPQAD